MVFLVEESRMRERKERMQRPVRARGSDGEQPRAK